MSIALKNSLSTILALVMALVTGVSVGKIYVDNLDAGIVLDITEDALRETDETISSLLEKMNSGATPDDFSAVELYVIAEYNLNNSEIYYKEMTGVVTATLGITQQMRSVRLKGGNIYLYDKLSPSTSSLTPQICSRIIYNASDEDRVLVYSTGTISTDSNSKIVGTFSNDNLVEYTMEEYKEIFNTSPTTALPYIISSITCEGATCTDVTANGDGTYSFSITFTDTTYLSFAALNYSYEIKYSSGMDDAPQWVSMSMNVVVDSNFNFVSISYEEVYKMNAPLIGWTAVTDNFVDVFYFGNDADAYLEAYKEVLNG